jgi:hypothetical protein
MMSHRPWIAILAGAAGGAVAIAIMEFLAERSSVPLAFIPFATSIVLVMGSPEAKPAQPRALIAGHLLSTAAGLSMVMVAGPQPWAAAIAVGMAIGIMHMTDSFHPPAGINPLLIVLNDKVVEFSHCSRRCGPHHAGGLRLCVAQFGAPRILAEQMVVRSNIAAPCMPRVEPAPERSAQLDAPRA